METIMSPEYEKKIITPKIIFFDVDQTLLSHKTLSIPESALYALKELKKKDIKLIIATGRGPSVTTLLEKYGITYDGYITLNGQYCFTNDQLLRKSPIGRKDLFGALSFLSIYPATCEFVGKDFIERNYTSKQAHTIDTMLGDTASNFSEVDLLTTIDKEIYQVNLYVNDDMDEEVRAYMRGCKVLRWHPAFNDVITKDGGKHKGVELFLEYYQIDKSESIAFGDGGNDIELLQAVEVGIAMGNSHRRVKGAADYVTTSVDEDGIYNALVKFGVISPLK